MCAGLAGLAVPGALVGINLNIPLFPVVVVVVGVGFGVITANQPAGHTASCSFQSCLFHFDSISTKLATAGPLIYRGPHYFLAFNKLAQWASSQTTRVSEGGLRWLANSGYAAARRGEIDCSDLVNQKCGLGYMYIGCALRKSLPPDVACSFDELVSKFVIKIISPTCLPSFAANYFPLNLIVQINLPLFGTAILTESKRERK